MIVCILHPLSYDADAARKELERTMTAMFARYFGILREALEESGVTGDPTIWSTEACSW